MPSDDFKHKSLKQHAHKYTLAEGKTRTDPPFYAILYIRTYAKPSVKAQRVLAVNGQDDVLAQAKNRLVEFVVSFVASENVSKL